MFIKIKKYFVLLLAVLLAACNMPSNNSLTTTTTATIESKVTTAWEECVSNTGVFTHVCLYAQLTSFSEATAFDAGFTVPANVVIMVNDSSKGKNPFIINGNQPAVEGQDFQGIVGAQTGLSFTYLTLKSLTMTTSGKQIVLSNQANPYVLFPGWPNWPPILPTALAIQTSAAVDPTSTPNIIPPAFTSGDLLNIWSSQTPDTTLVGLLDEAYEKWNMYGGEFTVAPYSFIRAGTILWSVDPSNIVDLSKQPYDMYNQGCYTTLNETNTVIYTVCDIYVVNPPFKYLAVSDWKEFQIGMIPAVPAGIHP
jgi:hypothetical protein